MHRLVTPAALPLLLLIAVGCGPEDGGSSPGAGGSGGDRVQVDRERMLWESGPSEHRVDAETVFDARTDLVWERVPSSARLSHAAAVARCEGLVLRGRDDWRLPTLIELTSLVEPTAVAPAIDAPAFPATPSLRTWTATRFHDDERGGYVVDFRTGATGSEGRDDEHHVRCVRGGKDVEAVYELSDELVRDTASGLRWQRGESPRAATFEEATAWCEALSAGGETDWRLPTVHELASLLVPHRAEPAADPVAFPEARPEGYWTSTAYAAGAGDTRWAVSFGGEFPGLFELYDPDEFFDTGPHVRCVR